MMIIFELIKTFEFELLSNDKKIRGKIELFRDLKNSEHYRFATSEAELFRLSPTFPMDEKGNPLHDSDETLWTEKIFPGIKNEAKEFNAENETEAIKIVLSRIEAFYHHVLI